MLCCLTSIWYYTALLLGLFTAVVWTYRTVCTFARSFGFGTRCTVERYGKGTWAVVTGATDGIGKASAQYLANEGFNVVLMSRTLAKLNTCADEIKKEAEKNGKKIETRVVQIDFTKTFDAPTFAKIYKEHLASLDISVLVNNVGMSGTILKPFFDNAESDVHNVISCNMYANVLLTREIVQGMKQRFEKTGARSCITYTSAMAAIVPVPSMGVYSASKIFTDFLTWGLGFELAKFNIDVSSWRAAGVATNMTGKPDTNVMVASPTQYVQAAMGKVTSGVHYGYFPHELMGLFWTNVNDIMPQSLCQAFFHKLLAAHAKDL